MPADLRRVIDAFGRANAAVRGVLDALEREVPRGEGA